MFNIAVTPEFLAYLLAGLTAILFDWFPGLSGWFDALSALKKREVMGAVLLVILAAIYGGVCVHLFSSTFACDQAGLATIVSIFLVSVGINQGIHELTKPTDAAKVRFDIGPKG